jgi:uncharacterized membrane protein YciS (DUF1049 family)
MDFSLLFAAILVIGMWVAILGIYLYVSRRQPTVVREIKEIEQQLDDTKEE